MAGDEGSQHPADAGIAHRARFLVIELEPVGGPGANPTAGVCQRRFGAKTGAGDERHEGSDHDPGCVAIVEASGLAKFEHQFGKDAVVIAKDLHQQPDQQTAEGADQQGEQRWIDTDQPCGSFPNQSCALMDEER